MSETNLPPASRIRHGLVEGMLGGAVALVAITVAHAALPELREAVQPPPVARRILPAAPAAAPPPPPVLIAFQSPLPDGEVGSPFGLRQLPWEDNARLHAGVDMIAPKAEPVLAAADGVVSRVGTDPGYGRFVELTHADGLTTRYGHLDRFADGVAPGAPVKSGQPVGRLGSTGTSTGLHVHFEIRDRQDRPLNPELFLGRSFATAADLPLREARRTGRRVRVAYVSRIPRSKRALMQAKLAEEAAEAAPSAQTAAANASAVTAEAAPAPASGKPHGRVRMRLQVG